ncbi:MAG: UDP-N-acetylmuramate:L-alanyl-gamma-D-glutamyl-meso-diaminopimelate ligase [Deltaproteobacteria bacterium]|nr:UDP-N-acetylmuramate:L-alanyl-gamma-D-glutamyl-meso-diaminopimelate ligase [Deltaproteobacteria bacterium]
MIPRLSPGAHVHFVAVCGVGTGSLAGLLHERGYRVTGSDENVYPPMSTFLAGIGIDILPGFSEAHVARRPDLVVIGNAVSRGNPEAEAVLRQAIPYVSLPQALGRFLVDGKRSVVVAGTHGKTTTASLMSWVLVAAGLDPSFFIGGIPVNFASGFRSGGGSWVVMEGDEYDSAFFDKGPKFLHYQPERVILTSLEFDHADIYRDLDHVKDAFRRLVAIIPAGGSLLVCDDAVHARELVRDAACPVLSYGLSGAADWQARDVRTERGRTVFAPCYKGDAEAPVELPLIGRHNAKNALAVYATAREIGLSASGIRSALASFRGVRRRQEIAGEAAGVLVIDDFAHHPTAVADTIAAVREAWPGRRLWAVFEPRSQTSRRRVFLEEFAEALARADRVLLPDLYHPEKIPEDQRLSPAELVDGINRRRGDEAASYLPGVDDIAAAMVRDAAAGDVVLVMSNGGFGGLPARIVAGLRGRESG